MRYNFRYYLAVIPCLTEPAPYLIQGNPVSFLNPLDSCFHRNDEKTQVIFSVFDTLQLAEGSSFLTLNFEFV
ncbi:MAG: hypothetical protein A2Y66_01230 [Nitrospirae bacterium RBG_13_41_22]|nr:MAG: hypothetical protein A2Y66_01230 [Nitrospirae bacterium RBG_13_41_22]